MDWREEPVSSQHDRAAFDCGSRDLNEYLHRHARQNHERGHTKTYVAVSLDDPRQVIGYYSIAPASVDFSAVPEELTKRFPRYPIPVFLLARLAVHHEFQQQGLGAELLVAAGLRASAVADEVGGFALLIDAKDEGAAGWYERFGAARLLDDELRLILPLATLARAVEIADSG